MNSNQGAWVTPHQCPVQEKPDALGSRSSHLPPPTHTYTLGHFVKRKK